MGPKVVRGSNIHVSHLALLHMIVPLEQVRMVYIPPPNYFDLMSNSYVRGSFLDPSFVTNGFSHTLMTLVWFHGLGEFTSQPRTKALVYLHLLVILKQKKNV
jgi:hypothetical protein